MKDDFSSQLSARILAGAAPVVVGLDPRVQSLPTKIAPAATEPDRILAFYREVLPRLAPLIPAVKPNIAFFERFGAAGFGCYEATCQLAKELGMLVIGDIKRGDIGSTAEAYAEGHFAMADALTLHPYLGRDSLAPFLSHCSASGKAVFVLVRTSNPSACEFQDLETPQGKLCDAIARAVDDWGSDLGDPKGFSLVGAVVGATWPDEVVRLRALMPRAWFLLPGVGAQGAGFSDVEGAFDSRGLGGLVAQSRGIMQCFSPDDAQWLDRIEQAAVEFARGIREVATA